MRYYDDQSSYQLGRTRMTPIVMWLLIINIGIFFLLPFISKMLFTGAGARGMGFDSYLQFFGSLHNLDSQYFGVWQPVTYMFLHGDFFHILFNMFALWMFGTLLEYNMGSKQFLIFYMAAGIGAGIILMFITRAPVLGASGAVMALLLGFAYFWPNLPVYIFGVFPIKAKWLVIGYGVISFLSISEGSHISHEGHLAGLGIGFIYLQLKYKKYNLFPRK